MRSDLDSNLGAEIWQGCLYAPLAPCHWCTIEFHNERWRKKLPSVHLSICISRSVWRKKKSTPLVSVESWGGQGMYGQCLQINCFSSVMASLSKSRSGLNCLVLVNLLLVGGERWPCCYYIRLLRVLCNWISLQPSLQATLNCTYMYVCTTYV